MRKYLLIALTSMMLVGCKGPQPSSGIAEEKARIYTISEEDYNSLYASYKYFDLDANFTAIGTPAYTSEIRTITAKAANAKYEFVDDYEDGRQIVYDYLGRTEDDKYSFKKYDRVGDTQYGGYGVTLTLEQVAYSIFEVVIPDYSTLIYNEKGHYYWNKPRIDFDYQDEVYVNLYFADGILIKYSIFYFGKGSEVDMNMHKNINYTYSNFGNTEVSIPNV